MNIQEELHALVNAIDDNAAKEVLHAVIDDLDEEQARQAVKCIRGVAVRHILEKLGFSL